MKDSALVKNMNKHVQDNFWLYIVSFLCICTGIVLGIYSVKYMGESSKQDLLNYVDGFFSTLNSENINYKSIFFQSLKNNFLMIAVVWGLGLTILGLPVAIILDVVKGFTIGFTVSFMVGGLGLKGVWTVILGILPQNVIYLCCLVCASVFAMEYSITSIRDRSSKRIMNSGTSRFLSYSVSMLTIFLIMIIGFFFEAYVTPNILKLLV